MPPMFGDTEVRHTDAVAREFKPSPRLSGAISRHERAQKELKAAKADLAEAIAEEVKGGAKMTDVGKAAKYAPEHVRRLSRARGVEGDPSRIPPPPPPTKQAKDGISTDPSHG